MADITNESRIVDWIRTAKHDQASSGGKELERLELVHYGASKEQTLWARDGLTRESDERELAIMICDAAQRDTDSLGGMQSYGLRAYYDGTKKKGFPFRFRLNAEANEMVEGRDLDSEPPTEKGITKQLMRHTEGAIKLAVGVSTNMLASSERENERLRTRIETLETRNMEVLSMYEKLLSLQHEREMDAVKFANREKRLDEAVDLVKQIGPGIVNRVTGKEIFAGATDPAIIELRTFIGTVKQEQLMKIMEHLDGTQKLALMQMMNSNLPDVKEKQS